MCPQIAPLIQEGLHPVSVARLASPLGGVAQQVFDHHGALFLGERAHGIEQQTTWADHLGCLLNDSNLQGVIVRQIGRYSAVSNLRSSAHRPQTTTRRIAKHKIETRRGKGQRFSGIRNDRVESRQPSALYKTLRSLKASFIDIYSRDGRTGCGQKKRFCATTSAELKNLLIGIQAGPSNNCSTGAVLSDRCPARKNLRLKKMTRFHSVNTRDLTDGVKS
ncbi:MAG TPA: hypothetical protein DCQ06_12035 [Myxococcales bacterium]|nr:hypothetical protein [Myxococcales bacterium]HAN32316.1 hypothetical protein [Myxococcales bacterium]